MKFWFEQLILYRSIIVLLLGIPWGVLLLSKESLEVWFVNGAYWVLTAYLLASICTLIWIFLRHRTQWVRWFHRYRLTLGWSLLVSFVLTVSIFSSNPFFYKTLSDETNLLSISRSLLIEKRAYNVTEGLYYYNNFHFQN